MIPTLEIEITGQNSQVIEEGFASGQVGPQEFVLVIELFKSGVKQQRQEIESGEK
jgi:hypothetical protein